MIKVFMPMYSLRPRGWLGGYTYLHRGFVHHPYPLGVFGRYFVPGPYYSVTGWIYQIRRTWHGVINIAKRGNFPAEPGTPYQQVRWTLFYNAVKSWQSMSQEEKDVYHHWTHPARASGYNRFISWYLRTFTVEPVFGNFILIEDGTYLLQETGSKIILES